MKYKHRLYPKAVISVEGAPMVRFEDYELETEDPRAQKVLDDHPNVEKAEAKKGGGQKKEEG